jgi:hypothetical protein
MWRREMDWLLSVADHIVEFVPSRQLSQNGSNIEVAQFHSNHVQSNQLFLSVEPLVLQLLVDVDLLPRGGNDTFAYCYSQVMVTRPRPDIHVNLPALKKLDGMLIVNARNSLVDVLERKKGL